MCLDFLYGNSMHARSPGDSYINHGIRSLSSVCICTRVSRYITHHNLIPGMLCLKIVTSLLCSTILLVLSTVDAHQYYSETGQSMRSDDVLSVHAGQTCPLAGACEVCQTAQISSNRYFHVCPDDGKQCLIYIIANACMAPLGCVNC